MGTEPECEAGGDTDGDSSFGSVSAANDRREGPCQNNSASPAFNNCIENYIGSDPIDSCADDITVNNETGVGGQEKSPWPPDINDTGTVNGGDWLAFNGHMGSQIGDAGYSVRLDLNADGIVNQVDKDFVILFLFKTCPVGEP